ncbi:MAG: hypothetical protein HYV18_05500 [Gammaproteobacteria bacterium]|nr:hypothetical protein [Gammaproteobacteria bacterium]
MEIMVAVLPVGLATGLATFLPSLAGLGESPAAFLAGFTSFMALAARRVSAPDGRDGFFFAESDFFIVYQPKGDF